MLVLNNAIRIRAMMKNSFYIHVDDELRYHVNFLIMYVLI